MRNTLLIAALMFGALVSGSSAARRPSSPAIVFFQQDTGLGYGYESIGYLCRSGADGSNQTRLAFGLGEEAPASPAFSPDGTRVAFVAPGLGGNHLPEVFVAPASGGMPDAVAPNVGFADSPSWTADGRWIVFGGMNFDLPLAARHQAFFRVRRDGGELEELQGGFGSSPAVSPDGTHIAFTSEAGSVDGQGDLWLLEVATGNAARLTGDRGWESDPSWSPDGRTIVFADDTGPLSTELSTIEPDGSGRRDLPETGGGHHPAFSPDGTKLAFTRDADIWVAGATGAAAVNVTKSPPGEGDPVWEPLAGAPRSPTRPCAVVGTARADVLRGSRYADVFYDGRGNDTIFAGAGADTIYVGAGDDRIWAGAGPDWIELHGGRNTIHAGPGDDEITGRFLPNPAREPQRIFGDAGDDRIYGGLASDVVDGGPGRDLLFGMLGADVLFGGVGVDQLAGGKGADILTGSAGDDLFLGGPGDDRLFAGDATQDSVHGGPGSDAARWDPHLDHLVGVEARIPPS